MSGDAAYDENGVLRDGARYRVPMHMRDGQSRMVGAPDLPARIAGVGVPNDGLVRATFERYPIRPSATRHHGNAYVKSAWRQCRTSQQIGAPTRWRLAASMCGQIAFRHLMCCGSLFSQGG